MMKNLLTLSLVLFPFFSANGGPYAPAAGQIGSTAVSYDSPTIASWATTVESYVPGDEVSASFQDSSQALGPVGSSPTVTVLGRGGSLTLSFSEIIQDGPGNDLAVFENSFSDTFLELAFVEVSSNGTDFVRFPNFSETPDPVSAFGSTDPTNVTGLAGKYRGGFGTPFDLADLPDDPNLAADAIQFVRLVDVVGGESLDSDGQAIYDPYPTMGSAGFDVDGVALLAPVPEPACATLLLFATGLVVRRRRS
jgi:hypothetical protein